MAGGVDGLALGAIGAGSLFLWAAVQGKSVTGTLQTLIKGGAPSTAPAANPITPGIVAADQAVTSAGPVPSSSSAQGALQQAAAARGWGTGPQWQALQNVEMAEAGFNPNATNPQSGAYGLAQALGHGDSTTRGSVTNEYGGFGLTSAQAQAANSGDAGAQALWMVNYIAATYGTPEAAWQHEQTYRWY